MASSTSSRRRFIGSAALVGTGAALTGAGAPAAAAPSPARRTAPGTAGATGASAKATFRWLGTSGWRIDVGDKTVLVDPYLSRYSTGLFDGHFDPATELIVDEGRIGDHPGTPETILVTHTHWDHYNDVPHIAQRSGARVFGTLTAYHLGLAYQVPAGQLSPVKGGEVMDFGAYTVEVAGSLHSRNGSYSLAFPGVRVAVPPRPRTVQDLPEGDTLAYQVSVAGGPKVFFMGASDFAERNLTGLAPDVAMLAVPATDVTHAYVPRLLAALDYPPVVVPVHWDDFETALQNPPTVSESDRRRLDLFVAAVRANAPRTRILVPEYLTPYTF